MKIEDAPLPVKLINKSDILKRLYRYRDTLPEKDHCIIDNAILLCSESLELKTNDAEECALVNIGEDRWKCTACCWTQKEDGQYCIHCGAKNPYYDASI